MSTQIRVAESTEPRIRLKPSSEPKISNEMVAAALGAELGAITHPTGGMTFAALRQRAIAAISNRATKPSDHDPFEFSPAIWTSLHKLANELRSDGLTISPSELASALLTFSIEAVNADRLGYIQKLRNVEQKLPGTVLPTHQDGIATARLDTTDSHSL